MIGSMRRITHLAAVAILVLTTLGSIQAAAGASATVAARQHIFGVANVDAKTGEVRPDRVVLSWLSVATLAASFRGHVVLLDTYIHKRESEPNYVPTTLDELIALEPELIFIGHGHFDHADTAGLIAVETGARVIGTGEHCAQVQAQALAHAGPTASVDCRAVIPAGAAPGTKTTLAGLVGGTCVTALKHLHSAAEPPDPTHDPTNVVIPLPDAGSLLLHPPGPDVLGQTLDGDEGGTVLYQFRVGAFSFTWHDSSGPLKERAPEVFDVLRALPPTDVQAGAVLGFNMMTNGLRDPAMYVDAIDPNLFIPLHHDFVTEYGSADDYEEPMRRELASYGPVPELRWLVDPHDYVRPELMTFHVTDPVWKDNGEPAGCM